MIDFQKYLSRHGEIIVQDLIERMERYEGVRSDLSIPLEQRWNALMQMTEPYNDVPLAA